MKKSSVFQIICLALIPVFSVAYLESDPSIFKWNGDPGPFTDESMWTHSARVCVLFGKYFIPPDSCSHVLFGGPLFTLISRLGFLIGGIHLGSVRAITVLFFWLTLALLFLLFKKSGYTNKNSVLPVLVLGLNHEALMESRWSTPTFVEIFFLTFCFFLLVHSGLRSINQTKKILCLGFAGLSLSAAIASKLSALIMLPTFIGILMVLVFPLRRLKVRDLPIFFGGAAFGLGLVGIFFLKYSTQMSVFLKTVLLTQKAPVFMNFSLVDAVHEVMTNSAISSPMVAPLMIGVIVLFVLRLKDGRKLIAKIPLDRLLLNVELLEALSFCWLVLGFVTFVFLPDRLVYRRFILFLVPISILFSKLVFKLGGSFSVATDFDLKEMQPREKWIMAPVFVFATAFYLPEMYSYLYKVWLSKVGIDTDFSLIKARWIEVTFLVFCFYGLIRFSHRAFVRVLLSVVCVINLSMNLYGLINPTFTFRDESIRLASLTRFGELNTGFMPWVFSFETKMMPIFFMKKEHYTDYNANFPVVVWNFTNDLIIFRGKSDGRPSSYFDDFFLNPKDFLGLQKEFLGTFRLAPFPGTTVYRIEAEVFRIHKTGLDKANLSSDISGATRNMTVANFER